MKVPGALCGAAFGLALLSIVAPQQLFAQQPPEEPPQPDSAVPQTEPQTLEPQAYELQPRKSPPFFKLLWLDAKYVVSRPFHWEGHDFLVLGGTLAVAGALVPSDQKTNDWARHKGPSLGTTGDILYGLGDARAMAVPAAFLIFGAIAHDQTARDAGVDQVLASVIGPGLVNSTIATIVGRARPDQEKGATSFSPGFNIKSGNRSFPSGHATEAFAISSAVAASYDRVWVKVLAFGAATVTCYGRLHDGKHFLSDVVVGAAIGTATGYSVVNYNRKLRHGESWTESTAPRLQLSPIIDRGTYGLTGSLTFQ